MTSTQPPALAVMPHDVEHNHHPAPPPADADPPPPQPPAVDVPKHKTPGSSRRGKQYKCGHCHELGHNQKTCPRRASVANEAHSIQPAIDADIFGTVAAPVAPALVGNGHHPPGPITRVQPAKIDAALEAANKRVVAADTAVANAKSEQEFEEATAQLDSAVRSLEKVAALAHRCAVVAHTLQGNWDAQQHATIVEREPKRMRMDPGPSAAASAAAAAAAAATTLPPNSITLNDATAAAATEAVEEHQVVVSEAKDEQHME